MKARTYKKLLRLNQDEQERLRYLSKSTGLNQEQVLRKVLMDAPLLERPTADYIKMSRQIAALGNNLNQLAHIANASGKVSNTDLLTAKQIMEQIWRYIKGGEAADQMVREALQVTEVAIKLSALGIKNALALSLAYAKENPKVKGKTSLDRLLREGKELKIIALQSKDVGQFKELAKQYGVLFAVIKDKAQNEKVDVMFKAEDVAKLNRIYEQLGYAIPKVTTADRKKDPTRRQSGDSLLTRGKNPLDIDPRPSVRATIMALKNAARTAAQAQEKVQDITAKEER